MRAAQENYSAKGQLAHVEREQVDIKADIRIMQHDIKNMATKADIKDLHHKIDGIENKLESKINSLGSRLESKIEQSEATMKTNIGWLKAINIAILATVLSIALTPIAQNMFKAPAQEAIPDKK